MLLKFPRMTCAHKPCIGNKTGAFPCQVHTKLVYSHEAVFSDLEQYHSLQLPDTSFRTSRIEAAMLDSHLVPESFSWQDQHAQYSSPVERISLYSKWVGYVF